MTDKRKAEYEIAYAEEAAVTKSQALIEWAMERAGVTQKELAKRLGISESAVSQLLGLSAQNLSVRRLGKILHVLEDELSISSKERDRWASERKARANDWTSVLRCTDYQHPVYAAVANDCVPDTSSYQVTQFEHRYHEMEDVA
ncbi:MAG: helix-turn-helix transcriptional regulator [Pseudomonadota bacterium]